MSGYSDLIGKKVVVTKSDGYRKYGVLKHVDSTVVVLIFDTGKEEYIPLLAVAAIALDEKVGE